MLSQRGERFIENPTFLQKMQQYVFPNNYDKENNPQGCINLGAAETILMADLVLPFLSSSPPIPFPSIRYNRFLGVPSFCQSLASFFHRHFLASPSSPPPSPNHIAVTNGGGTAVESLLTCLSDPGDHILIPSPFYHGFVLDVEKRFGTLLLPFPLLSEDFSLDLDQLSSFYEQATKEGKRIKVLIHCNPHNPTGKIFSRETTEGLIKWCVERKIHLISDEVYALSVFNPRADAPFVSAMKISRELREGPSPPSWAVESANYVHLVYSLSKDFGLNGFRVGVIYTENQKLLASLASISIFTSVSTETQFLLTRMFEDQNFVDNLIQTNQKRLKERYEKCVELLESLGLKVFPSEAGTFIWADMRSVRGLAIKEVGFLGLVFSDYFSFSLFPFFF